MLCIITQASFVWICSDLIARSSHLLFYHWGYPKSYKVRLLLKSLILDCPYWQLWLKSRKMIFWISLLRRRRHLSQKWTYPAPLKFFPSLPSACASQMQPALRWAMVGTMPVVPWCLSSPAIPLPLKGSLLVAIKFSWTNFDIPGEIANALV